MHPATAFFTVQIPDDTNHNTRLHINIGAYFWQTLERLALVQNSVVVESGAATLASFVLDEK
ncbi:MAG: hypothetical protein JXA89_00205 [Anaerolineae bacterium]|nr:hypothetical protein [Anaerolineae bacterium]